MIGKRIKESLFLMLANHLPRLTIFDRYRFILLKFAGVKILGKCVLSAPFNITPVGGAINIEIGEGTFINTDVRFGVPKSKVSIGRNVLIGPRVMFETMNHGLVFKPGKSRGGWTKSIIVEDGAWIGAGSIVTQGVTIGRGAVVTAGSVVSRDVSPDTLVGGVPAKFISYTKDSA